jgi:hypothetical protein
MTITKKQIYWTLIATFTFYVVGRLVYEPFYRLTLSVITSFSDHQLKFFGKFPFLFFGDPVFGLVTATIPISFLLCYLILANQVKKVFRRTLLFNLIMLTGFYFITCYYESFYLIASNDFYKGEPLSYSPREVNINYILLSSIILTTIMLAIINFIKKYFGTK